MSELNPELAAALLEACRGGAGEAAEALARALGGEFSLTIGETAPHGETPEFDGPGLVILFHVGETALAAVLPASSGMLPEWYESPDATGASKLATLAQELSMLLLPETLAVGEMKASHAANLKEALSRGGVAADATAAAIEAISGEKKGQLKLIWPLASPKQTWPAAEATPPAQQEAKPAAEAAAKSVAAAAPAASAAKSDAKQSKAPDFTILPGYSRSLLKIRVPVIVELACKKESVQEVISLAPGSIIKFDKGCEELLQLVVGGHAVAEGEAVKIGEKFGFRVSSMLMPPEHFKKVKRPRSA